MWRQKGRVIGGIQVRGGTEWIAGNLEPGQCSYKVDFGTKAEGVLKKHIRHLK